MHWILETIIEGIAAGTLTKIFKNLFPGRNELALFFVAIFVSGLIFGIYRLVTR